MSIKKEKVKVPHEYDAKINLFSEVVWLLLSFQFFFFCENLASVTLFTDERDPTRKIR